MADENGTKGKDDFEQERPLVSYVYDLTSALVIDMSVALAGDRKRNPASVVCACLLVIIVMLAASPVARQLTPLLVVLIVVEMATWTLSSKWQAVQLRRLRKAGFDLALAPEGKRRRTVSVFEDRVVVEEPSGHKTSYPVSEMRRPRSAGEMLVLRFQGGFVPVPRHALSASRYNDLLRFVAERTGMKYSE